jgi:hypothetical protein
MYTIPTFTLNKEEFFNYMFNNSYIAIYPELFLILTISALIAFLVVLDYINKYKFILATLTAKILI